MIQKFLKSMLAFLCLSALLAGCGGRPEGGTESVFVEESSENEPENISAQENNEIDPENADEVEPERALASQSGEAVSESAEWEEYNEMKKFAETGAKTDTEKGAEAESGTFAISEEYADMEPVLLENPGVGFYLAKEPETVKEHTLHLEQVYEKANAITDEEGWFAANQLEAPFYKMVGSWIGEGDVPEGIPDTFEGYPLTQAGFDDSFLYCVYGEQYYSGYLLNLYDRKTCAPVLSLDFSEYCCKESSPSAYQWIRWARAEGNVLYVSLSHNTYSETAPDHAYIVAVDLTDMSVLWKTEPLVSNARNFEIIGNEIVCGYGFTAEDDFLYQIDCDTGRILEQIPLKTMADYIIRKDDQLFVRTYNTNYIFQITQ